MIMHAFAASTMGPQGTADVVTVSGETISDTQASPPTVGVRFNSDGTVDKHTSAGYAQIDSATDWVKPNASAPGLYEVFCTLVSGNLSGGSPADSALDTWLALTSNREWNIQTAGGLKTTVVDVSIRLDGGATLNTGRYTLNSEDTA